MKIIQYTLFIFIFAATNLFSFGLGQADVDQDGITDSLEHQLLEQYRPYYRFSTDGAEEHYNPTDVGWYLRRSELLTTSDESSSPLINNSQLGQNIFRLIEGSRDITQYAGITAFYINPLANWGGTSNNPGRHGNSWDEILQRPNIGLYGHVVPIKLPNVDAYDAEHVFSSQDTGITFYKIEYWQFFGYNNAAKPADLGDHEGDWTTVQLLVDSRDINRIAMVLHYTHGIEFRFNLQRGTPVMRDLNEQVLDFSGANARSEVSFDGDTPFRPNEAQDNRLQLYIDPITRRYTHPVVYVEYGGHEFWPMSGGSFSFAPKHNGSSRYTYLTSTPPNLGEVEAPMQETPDALVILRFNGRWGAYSKSLPRIFKTDPPQGPPLHYQWTWPYNSSIRWKLQGLGH